MFNFLEKIVEINPWKTKAIERRNENKNLKKDNKRLHDSRNKWKKIALKYKEQNEKLNYELKKN